MTDPVEPATVRVERMMVTVGTTSVVVECAPDESWTVTSSSPRVFAAFPDDVSAKAAAEELARTLDAAKASREGADALTDKAGRDLASAAAALEVTP